MTTNTHYDVLEKRIIELETKLAFQEDLLQELNKLVIVQQSQIDKLETLSNLLKDQYKEIISSLPEASSGDEIPPHY